MLRKKYEHFFFCGLPGEIFFLTPGQMETIFFLGLNYDFLRCWELHTLSFDLSYFNETPFLFIQWRIKNQKKKFHYTLISKKNSEEHVPANIYLFKVNQRNTRKRCDICSKLTIKKPERCQWPRSGVFIVNFQCIANLVMSLLSTLSK